VHDREVSSSENSGAPRWWLPRWFFGIKWFAGQFAVVVAGILAALALQAWYESHQRADDWHKALEAVRADLAADTIVLNRSIMTLTLQLNGLEIILDSAQISRMDEDSAQAIFNRTAPVYMRYSVTTVGYDRFKALGAGSSKNQDIQEIVTQFHNRDQYFVREWDDIARTFSVHVINQYLVDHVPFSIGQLSRQARTPRGDKRFASADVALLMRQDAFQRLLLRHHYIKVWQREVYNRLLVRARVTAAAIDTGA